eukprot:SAG11_NODE_17308_length_522_cov_0.718676_1_plen_49_part_10
MNCCGLWLRAVANQVAVQSVSLASTLQNRRAVRNAEWAGQGYATSVKPR